MELLRIFLIIVVLLIFIKVLHTLLKDRQTIQKEGFDEDKDEAKNEKSVTDKIKDMLGIGPPITISNMNPKTKGLPLREYCIKASYNSAYSGSTISTKMIRYVLSRGCRFLDLQVHYSKDDGIAYVAHITDSKLTEMASKNKVPLDTIFNFISANAFMGSQGSDGCPNPSDPLFIHLRIIPDENMLVYQTVSECINKNFSSKNRVLNADGNAKKIDMYTRMNDRIMGKTMFLIDKSDMPEYAFFSQKFANLMNGETNGSTFEMRNYSKMDKKDISSPIINDDYKTTNIIKQQIVIPDILERHSPPSIINMVVNYGVQITMYSFYKSSDQLLQCEDFFNKQKSAIVLMARSINTLDKTKTDLEGKTLSLGPQ